MELSKNGNTITKRVAYFGGVEPDQVEGVEVERRVGTVEDGPGAELRGGEARDYDARELRVIAAEVSSDGGRALEEEEEHREEQERGRARSHLDVRCFVLFVFVCLPGEGRQERAADCFTSRVESFDLRLGDLAFLV